MQSAELARNPFALLMNPEAVIAEIDRSGRLSRLKSRICRPLDKSSGPLVPADDAALADDAIGDGPAAVEP